MIWMKIRKLICKRQRKTMLLEIVYLYYAKDTVIKLILDEEMEMDLPDAYRPRKIVINERNGRNPSYKYHKGSADKSITICISPNCCAKKCFQAHWESLSYQLAFQTTVGVLLMKSLMM